MPESHHGIVASLEGLAVPIVNLQPDSNNANIGDVEAIKRSLEAFGQRKPVVVRRTLPNSEPSNVAGTVIAGNHVYKAAESLGWSHVAAVFVDDDDDTAKAYALADNRTGELAEWDGPRLIEHLRDLSNADYDMESLGWTNAELARMLGDAEGELVSFKAYDESAADDVKTVTCPNCKEVIPL